MDHHSPLVLRDEVDHLDRECARLIAALKQLANSVPPHLLYRHPPHVSIGENLLRSAAALEQTFNGLTANLWDDPFEWTLPETLSTAELVTEYLSEVDAARESAFRSIASDSDLTKYISGPSGEPQQLFALLLETLMKASDYHGRAVATVKMFFA
jgi:hypothetical protein